jgi:hypothetical protein
VPHFVFFDLSDVHSTQYAKYSTISGMSATPVPLATIGGARDGRAPVVVMDDAQKPEQVEAATSIVPNQPVPGPDVFDRQEGSQSVGMPQPSQEKEKEAQEVTSNDQKSIEKVDPAPPPQVQEPQETSSQTEEAATQTTAAGAKDEAEAERDRVMEELFGKEN